MPDIKEDLLQFIWQHKLYDHSNLITKEGNPLEILHTGELNTNAGADFFNAKIKLNGLILAGNIEIHVRSSDWLKHNHQTDVSYNTIILHVVYEHDKDIPQNTQHNVEVLELKNLIPSHLLSNYHTLLNSKQTLACKNGYTLIPDTIVNPWLQRMAIERLEKKMSDIAKISESFNNDLTQTFYTILLRNFGFKVNSLPFELLASYLPIHILLKHTHSLLQTESLLLGTAGMLEEEAFEDPYMKHLQNEFEFLKNKYKLSTLQKHIFKSSRMRPANFPQLRLAQFAALIHNNTGIFNELDSIRSIQQIKEVLNFEMKGYWRNHYKTDGPTTTSDLNLGATSKENILVNTFSYFLYFYGRKLNKPSFEELAVQLLEECDFELNNKTKLYPKQPNTRLNAIDSQGMIHLHDTYCVKKRCLSCAIGVKVLKEPN